MTQQRLPQRAECVIVGAGLAGAAAAYALVRQGLRDVVVVEMEPVAGYHASGRNAAMAYSFIAQSLIRRLARQGLAFLADPPADFPLPLDNRFTGSLSLVDRDQVPRFEALAEALRDEGVPLEEWSAADIRRRIPVLGELDDGLGYFVADDGVIDVNALLQGYLKAARQGGAKIVYRCRAETLLLEDNRVVGLRTALGQVRAPRVVLAAGPWANELAVRAGLAPLPLSPCRRHLALLADGGFEIDPHWPFVWHQTRQFYFRPESGGLLVCGCDVEEVLPADVRPDADQVAWLAERSVALIPAAAGAKLRNAWAGLRTLTPDEHFIVGPDPRLRGLYWVAGLGGHGMTTSPAVGELLAHVVLEKAVDIDLTRLAPARFLSADAGG